jgi:hypothetical protein
MWVRQAVTKPTPIRKLNVGHHLPTGKANDTSDQRRVVIIIVLDREDGTPCQHSGHGRIQEEGYRSPRQGREDRRNGGEVLASTVGRH